MNEMMIIYKQSVLEWKDFAVDDARDDIKFECARFRYMDE